jgi:hypothetical protein
LVVVEVILVVVGKNTVRHAMSIAASTTSSACRPSVSM